MSLPPGFVEDVPQAVGGKPPPGFVEDNPALPPENKWLRRASTYGVHPLIEGGGMAASGAAGAIMAAPAGPIASGAAGAALGIASYPPLHRAANAVDEMIGLPKPEETPLPQALKEGAMMEAAGQAIPAVAGAVKGAVSKVPFAKIGSAFTGTSASNLRRAFDKGLSTYWAKPLEEAGANYGVQESRVIGQNLTSQEQADLLTNAGGVASSKLNDVTKRWLDGEDISVKDALQAKQAINTMFPSDTAKKAVLRGKMSQFGNEMNAIIAAKDPPMRQAIGDYADSSLRSQLLQPLRVNKLNQNEPSKLGIMMATEGIATSDNPFSAAFKTFTLQSPAFAGFVSSLSGQIAKAIPTMSADSQKALARGLYSAFLSSQNGGQK